MLLSWSGGKRGQTPGFLPFIPPLGLGSDLHSHEALRPLFRNWDNFPNFSPNERRLFF